MGKYRGQNGMSFFNPKEQIEGTIFSKKFVDTYYSGKLDCRCIGMDADLLRELRDVYGIVEIRVYRKPSRENVYDSGEVYTAKLEDFFRYGSVEDSGWGEQVFLPLCHFVLTDYRKAKEYKAPKPKKIKRVKVWQNLSLFRSQ